MLEDVKLSLNQVADLLEKKFPKLWNRFNVKHIDPPGNYYGFKMVAVTLACASMEFVIQKSQRGMNTLLAGSVLEKFGFPTYYVSGPLIEALMRTHPPRGMTWGKVFMPYEGMAFMVPRDMIREPGGDEITMLGIARIVGGKHWVIDNIEATVNGDKVILFWSVRNGSIVQDCTFPTSQLLEPSPGWIDEITHKYEHLTHYPLDAPSGEFSSYLAGLVANFILVMSARKELVEPGKRRTVLPSGIPSYSPSFIGRNYKVIKSKRLEVSGSHFTEIGWRSGYIRLQSYGPRDSPEKRVILIDPYLAFTRGLRREVPVEDESEEGGEREENEA